MSELDGAVLNLSGYSGILETRYSHRLTSFQLFNAESPTGVPLELVPGHGSAINCPD